MIRWRGPLGSGYRYRMSLVALSRLFDHGGVSHLDPHLDSDLHASKLVIQSKCQDYNILW
jgi:hypothetical protein